MGSDENKTYKERNSKQKGGQQAALIAWKKGGYFPSIRFPLMCLCAVLRL